VSSFRSRRFAHSVVAIFLLGGLPVAVARAAEPSYSILHSFQVVESDPLASLTSDGHGNLYGTTLYGGNPTDMGTVYTVRSDGTGFRRLHTFFGGSNDGLQPEASLILDGSGNLYGTTFQGGSSNAGTVFTLRTDGAGFQVLHSFVGGPNDGRGPYASLILDSAGNLYGTTFNGGPSDFGTVYSLRADGSGFRLLHGFIGGAGDGLRPAAALILDASGNLYGTTSAGGRPDTSVTDYGAGIVFTIKTDGSGFRLLHAFLFDAVGTTGLSGSSSGSVPAGSLITDDSGSLYGMTRIGGSSNGGAVFKIGMDGSGFQILHSFGGANDGNYPIGPLVLDRLGNLYGVTQGPNAESPGLQTIFKVRTDGTGYQLLHVFVDPNDGITPSGSLILDGSDTLYGTTYYGGSSYSGTVFSVKTDGRLFQALYAFTGYMNGGTLPFASVIGDWEGSLYGTTFRGGLGSGDNGGGTVFRIGSDGTSFQVLHLFAFGANDGLDPAASLILDRAGFLYGTTMLGGGPLYNGTDDLGGGTLFKVRTDGTGFQLLHAFSGGADDGLSPSGGSPSGAVILDDADNLYGTTNKGGASGAGTVFRIRTDGTGFQLLHTFTPSGVYRASPSGPLLLDGSGNLYGTTARGGPSNLGTVFKLRTDGVGFQVLHSFTDTPYDGSQPSAALIMDRLGNLYGTTPLGGSANAGTVFKMKADGANFRILHSFAKDASDGVAPYAALTLDAFGNLYGTTGFGGSSGVGTVFTLKTDGAGYRILHAFGEEASDGQRPMASLFLDDSGTLFGTTSGGGAGQFGTVFSLSVGAHPVVTQKPFVPVWTP
jgi:uncharacterized repeat protein (TIGR03803 family)